MGIAINARCYDVLSFVAIARVISSAASMKIAQVWELCILIAAFGIIIDIDVSFAIFHRSSLALVIGIEMGSRMRKERGFWGFLGGDSSCAREH